MEEAIPVIPGPPSLFTYFYYRSALVFRIIPTPDASFRHIPCTIFEFVEIRTPVKPVPKYFSQTIEWIKFELCYYSENQ
ncbi:hypothetical protein [Thiorhodococcus fuscus]|uniref:Uncharacterized protein n=1 Tax=Thiorhodococcus fuscus TaxID=527200 RepID=A0ABW4YDS0_9GAMM